MKSKVELGKLEKDLIKDMYRSGRYHLTEIAKTMKVSVYEIRKVLKL